jgi:hypothetical protein
VWPACGTSSPRFAAPARDADTVVCLSTRAKTPPPPSPTLIAIPPRQNQCTGSLPARVTRQPSTVCHLNVVCRPQLTSVASCCSWAALDSSTMQLATAGGPPVCTRPHSNATPHRASRPILKNSTPAPFNAPAPIPSTPLHPPPHPLTHLLPGILGISSPAAAANSSSSSSSRSRHTCRAARMHTSQQVAAHTGTACWCGGCNEGGRTRTNPHPTAPASSRSPPPSQSPPNTQTHAGPAWGRDE